VAKAGINATLKSRCALLGAANPKLGRFDEYVPIHEQINMPPTLLSRFDLIFSITDKPDKTRDENLATHVLRVHKAGEIHENIQRESNETQSGKDIIVENSPVFEPSFLRKYIAYAKRHIFPVLSDEALKEIKNYYVSMRSASQDSIPFTPRQLEAFVRLTEASARIRLDKKAGIEDARRAIKIVEDYLKRVGVDRETGFFDIDVIHTGISHSQHERMRVLIDIIKKLCNESKSGLAAREDIISMAETEGIEAARAEEALTKLRINGQIFEPKSNKYRLP
jgi:replicative DNA helicase Mcm